MRRMRFPSTFRAFRWEDIPIVDTIGDYIDGVWVEREPLIAPRLIQAIPLAMGSDDLQIYSNGSASETGITLTTKEKLYWTDITATEQVHKQSYALWQNYKWRVVGNNLMLGNASDLSIYALLRYIE